MRLTPLSAAAATLALGACAGTDPLPETTAALYRPVELTSLMVLSPDGDHILGNIGEVTVEPDGRARTVVIEGGAPLFPTGRRMVVAAQDLRIQPFLGTAWLVGEPWRVVAGFDPAVPVPAPGVVPMAAPAPAPVPPGVSVAPVQPAPVVR